MKVDDTILETIYNYLDRIFAEREISITSNLIQIHRRGDLDVYEKLKLYQEKVIELSLLRIILTELKLDLRGKNGN